MTINTKYNVTNIVFFMLDNRVCQGNVAAIVPQHGGAKDVGDYNAKHFKYDTTKYSITDGYRMYNGYEEKDLFPSKEELLKSL